MGVGQAGRTLLEAALGQRQIEPSSLPATVETVYDLASLTKAVVTSLLVMKGVERGGFIWTRRWVTTLGCWRTGREVTLRRVLGPCRWLSGPRKFYEEAFARRHGPKTAPRPAIATAIVERAAAEPLVYPPGSQSVYSDLGFILLGALVEQSMGERLDVLAERLLFRPLRLSRIGFVQLPGGWCVGEVRGRRLRADRALPGARPRGRGRGPRSQRLCHGRRRRATPGSSAASAMCCDLPFALCRRLSRPGRCAAARLSCDPEVLRQFWRPAGIPGSSLAARLGRPGRDGLVGGRADFPARRRSPVLHRLLAVDRSRAGNLRGRSRQPHPSRGARRSALPRAFAPPSTTPLCGPSATRRGRFAPEATREDRTRPDRSHRRRLRGKSAPDRRGPERARAAGADCLVLPELALCGYPPRDLLERDAFLAGERRAALATLAASVRGRLAVLVGFPEVLPESVGGPPHRQRARR